MNEIEITNKLKRDSNLCEAVRRAQEELPLLPSGFSDKLMICFLPGVYIYYTFCHFYRYWSIRADSSRVWSSGHDYF